MAVFLALGFRPFFFLAGFSAVILMATWVPAFLGGIAFSTYYGQIDWHSHEMIFGYTIAVVAGFLLTAVRNWTERPTPAGGYLAIMVALWLFGRILPFFSGILPSWFIALVDLSFLPVVAIGIGVPLVRCGESRNCSSCRFWLLCSRQIFSFMPSFLAGCQISRGRESFSALI
jgi:uncharacterized protein involved in response to NO